MTTTEKITIFVNGKTVSVTPGTRVSGALLSEGILTFRRSVGGLPRGPLCGMGVCFECCVMIDGQPHEKSCQRVCREGMTVQTE